MKTNIECVCRNQGEGRLGSMVTVRRKCTAEGYGRSHMTTVHSPEPQFSYCPRPSSPEAWHKAPVSTPRESSVLRSQGGSAEPQATQ